MSRQGARAERLLPVLSGVLLVVSFPPFRLLLPPFLALAPMLVFLADRPLDPTGRWAALRAGFLMGLVYFGLLLYWLIVALIFYSPLAILAWAVTVVILAGFTAVFAGAVVYVRERMPAAPMPLVAAMLWTTLEWVQAHLGDVSFPWLGLGSSLAGFPRLAGAADLVGARGLTFWLALVNGLVAWAVLAWRARRSPARPLLLAAFAIAIPAGYGSWRAATLRLAPIARVAVVQPNIPEDLKLDRERSLDSSMVALTNLTRRIPAGSVDLVVWPEVAVQAFVAAPGAAESMLRDRIVALARELRAPILVGAYGYGPDSAPAQGGLSGAGTGAGAGGAATRTAAEPPAPGGRPVAYNSAFMITPAGLEDRRYDKQFLVPIVERVPFMDPAWLEGITGPLDWFGGLGRGTGAPLFATPRRARFGVLICYESIFAPLARRYRAEGADFLVNVTNDSWYGREAPWARTSALWQHPAHLVMRAIETRTGIARAANTGFSLFVDPLGRTYRRTRLFQPGVRVATVYTTADTTLFVAFGDWLATLAAAGSVVLLLGCWIRRGRGGALR